VEVGWSAIERQSGRSARAGATVGGGAVRLLSALLLIGGGMLLVTLASWSVAAAQALAEAGSSGAPVAGAPGGAVGGDRRDAAATPEALPPELLAVIGARLPEEEAGAPPATPRHGGAPGPHAPDWRHVRAEDVGTGDWLQVAGRPGGELGRRPGGPAPPATGGPHELTTLDRARIPPDARAEQWPADHPVGVPALLANPLPVVDPFPKAAQRGLEYVRDLQTVNEFRTRATPTGTWEKAGHIGVNAADALITLRAWARKWSRSPIPWDPEREAEIAQELDRFYGDLDRIRRGLGSLFEPRPPRPAVPPATPGERGSWNGEPPLVDQGPVQVVVRAEAPVAAEASPLGDGLWSNPPPSVDEGLLVEAAAPPVNASAPGPGTAASVEVAATPAGTADAGAPSADAEASVYAAFDLGAGGYDP